MKKVSIGFSNMWGRDDTFTAEYFYQLFPFLRGEYDFKVLLDRDPDVMFYSVYGYIRRSAIGSIRVLISGEAGDHFTEGGKMSQDFSDPHFFHYAITSFADNHSPHHFYVPGCYWQLQLYNGGPQVLIRDGSPPAKKEFFCNFVYSNPYSMIRRQFCKELNHYKTVLSAGHVDRNTDILNDNGYDKAGYLAKQAFQSRCKFSISFENNYVPGYTTEKLSDPFVAKSVPLYSGNPSIAALFNSKAFINVDSYATHQEAIEWIKYVDNNDYEYNKYLAEPPLIDNKIPMCMDHEAMLKFFRGVLG